MSLRKNLEFLLNEMLNVEELCSRERYLSHSSDTFMATLDAAERIAQEKFSPHAHAADEAEPTFDGQRVSMIPDVKEAVRAFGEAGFLAAGHDAELGGMQLPITMVQASLSLFRHANTPTSAYLFLTSANANLIRAYGSDAQRKRYLPALLSGRWLGTMAITEPQAGSAVSNISSTAVPTGEGRYFIRGSKIFISGGDHELTENIVHLVLARLPDAPAGAKGLSLFLVPKFLVDESGRLGARNDVALAGLIHKMGYRGTTSTMLNFGENNSCIGELIGAPHKGLDCMFHMMNEARVGVGLGAVILAYAAYEHALEYAKSRSQGQRAGLRSAEGAQVMIIEHADVRRMLLTQKAYVEGGLALCMMGARLADDAATEADSELRAQSQRLLSLLTPVIKSWPAQFCLEANALAIQVHGGYGYTREYPVERLYRDNRLNALHEGTTGIQGIDLLGRKVGQDNGAALTLLAARVFATVAIARQSGDRLSLHADQLKDEWSQLQDTTAVLLAAQRTDREAALANASIYLETFGRFVVAWVWLDQLLAACKAHAGGRLSDEFLEGKRAACRWFFECELPHSRAQHGLLRRIDNNALKMRTEWF